MGIRWIFIRRTCNVKCSSTGSFSVCASVNSGIGDGFKGYYPGSLHDALTATLGKESGKLPSTSKAVYLTAKYVNQETSNRFYCKAQNLSLKLKAAYDKALEKYDVLVMPTVPFIAPTYTDLPNMTAGTITRE